jgi:hypothetical protein
MPFFIDAQNLLNNGKGISWTETTECNCVVKFWLPVAAAMAQPSQRQPVTKNVCKTRGCNYSF